MSIIKKMSDYWTILNFWVGLTGITGFRYNLTPCFIDHHRRSYTQGSATRLKQAKTHSTLFLVTFLVIYLGSKNSLAIRVWHDRQHVSR